MENESGRDSSDEESAKELEDELYSVLHHNDFSEGIPEHLHEKYNISYNSDNELEISFKNGESGYKSSESFQKETESDKTVQTEVQSEQSERYDKNSRSENFEDIAFKVDKPKSSVSSDSEDVILVEKKHDLIALSSDSEEAFKKDADSDIEIVNISRKSDDSDIQIINVSNKKNKKKQKKKNMRDYDYFWDPSDDDLDSSLLVNFSQPNFERPIQVDVSDVVESNVDWKDVVSPKSWTQAMKKFYNRPDNKLRNFDHHQILRDIKQERNTSWLVSNIEFSYRRPPRRCHLCRQIEHTFENCPKRFSNCKMCGNEGHNSQNCPNQMCLNCGAKSYVFVERCSRCSIQWQRQCRRCERTGHEERLCPDNWRQYSNLHGRSNNDTNPRVFCCNCGSQGHFDDECPLGYTNHFPTSSLVDRPGQKSRQNMKFSPNKKPRQNSNAFPRKKRSPQKRVNSHFSPNSGFKVLPLNVRRKKQKRNRLNSI